MSSQGEDEILWLAALACARTADALVSVRHFEVVAALAGIEAAVENAHGCWCRAKDANAGPCACCELRELLGIAQPRESRFYRGEPSRARG